MLNLEAQHHMMPILDTVSTVTSAQFWTLFVEIEKIASQTTCNCLIFEQSDTGLLKKHLKCEYHD